MFILVIQALKVFLTNLVAAVTAVVIETILRTTSSADL